MAAAKRSTAAKSATKSATKTATKRAPRKAAGGEGAQGAES